MAAPAGMVARAAVEAVAEEETVAMGGDGGAGGGGGGGDEMRCSGRLLGPVQARAQSVLQWPPEPPAG
jgi:hypothetical protein